LEFADDFDEPESAMGGFGSGRRGGATVESYRRIDVRVLHLQRQLI